MSDTNACESCLLCTACCAPQKMQLCMCLRFSLPILGKLFLHALDYVHRDRTRCTKQCAQCAKKISRFFPPRPRCRAQKNSFFQLIKPDSSEKNSGECLQKALAIFFARNLRRLLGTNVFTTTKKQIYKEPKKRVTFQLIELTPSAWF